MTRAQLPEPSSESSPAVPAPWGPRLAAWILDGAIAWAIAFVAAIPFAIGDTSSDVGTALWLALALAMSTVYFAVTMCRGGIRNGQTLGKQAVGMRVVRTDGQPVGLGTVVFRELFLKAILGWMTGIGWVIDGLWPLADGRHRALHDFAARTRVVSDDTPVAPPLPPLPAPAPTFAPPKALAPAIQRHLTQARAAEAGIREAIARAELPYAEVDRDVDSLIAAMQRSAERAQLLHEALDATPVARVEGRIRELRGTDRHELVDALGQQLEVQRRIESQLGRFDDQMERIVVELETIRSSLLSVSASTDVDNQRRLAERVRDLRDETTAVATGMSAGFD